MMRVPGSVGPIDGQLNREEYVRSTAFGEFTEGKRQGKGGGGRGQVLAQYAPWHQRLVTVRSKRRLEGTLCNELEVDCILSAGVRLTAVVNMNLNVGTHLPIAKIDNKPVWSLLSM